MTRDDEADQWFYNLGTVAKRVEDNEKKAKATTQRQYVVTAFVVFAFLLLAWRSEVNADRITDNNIRLEEEQDNSCLRGRAILERFNAQQAALAALALERNDEETAAVYTGFRIDPLPKCEEEP